MQTKNSSWKCFTYRIGIFVEKHTLLVIENFNSVHFLTLLILYRSREQKSFVRYNNESNSDFFRRMEIENRWYAWWKLKSKGNVKFAIRIEKTVYLFRYLFTSRVKRAFDRKAQVELNCLLCSVFILYVQHVNSPYIESKAHTAHT